MTKRQFSAIYCSPYGRNAAPHPLLSETAADIAQLAISRLGLEKGDLDDSARATRHAELTLYLRAKIAAFRDAAAGTKELAEFLKLNDEELFKAFLRIAEEGC